MEGGPEAGDGGGSETGTGEAGASVGCYALSGSGASRACAWETSDAPGFSCSGSLRVGTCPSAGLVGCCIETVMSGGFTVVAAGCYYNATTAMAAMSSCTGAGDSWSTTAP
jgi:hypothetical protein